MSLSSIFRWRARVKTGSPSIAGSSCETLTSHVSDTNAHPDYLKKGASVPTGREEFVIARHEANRISHAENYVRRAELIKTKEQYDSISGDVGTEPLVDNPNNYRVENPTPYIITRNVLKAILNLFVSTESVKNVVRRSYVQQQLPGVGGEDQPVYVDANGIVRAMSRNIGGSSCPIYIENGKIKSFAGNVKVISTSEFQNVIKQRYTDPPTESDNVETLIQKLSDVGDGSQLVLIKKENDGYCYITLSDKTIGSIKNPVYLKDGVIKPIIDNTLVGKRVNNGTGGYDLRIRIDGEIQYINKFFKEENGEKVEIVDDESSSPNLFERGHTYYYEDPEEPSSYRSFKPEDIDLTDTIHEERIITSNDPIASGETEIQIGSTIESTVSPEYAGIVVPGERIFFTYGTWRHLLTIKPVAILKQFVSTEKTASDVRAALGYGNWRRLSAISSSVDHSVDSYKCVCSNPQITFISDFIEIGENVYSSRDTNGTDYVLSKTVVNDNDQWSLTIGTVSYAGTVDQDDNSISFTTTSEESETYTFSLNTGSHVIAYVYQRLDDYIPVQKGSTLDINKTYYKFNPGSDQNPSDFYEEYHPSAGETTVPDDVDLYTLFEYSASKPYGLISPIYIYKRES